MCLLFNEPIHNTVTTTDIKTNKRHIHTSIVSRHLATRGNNKILRTHPPHIISSEELLSRHTRRTLDQLRINNHPFSNHTYSNLTPNHINHHYAFVPHTNRTRPISSTTPTYAIGNLGFVDDPTGLTALLARLTGKLAGGPQAGISHSPNSQGHETG